MECEGPRFEICFCSFGTPILPIRNRIDWILEDWNCTKWTGLKAIPGGKVRLGETLQQAAEREILEETGIHIKAGDPVFAFDLIENDDSGGVRWHYAIIDLQADYISGEIRAGDDAIAAAWFKPEDLATVVVNSTTRKLLQTEFGFVPWAIQFQLLRTWSISNHDARIRLK